MTYREITRKLITIGCQELPRRGRGSHRKWFNPKGQRVSILSDWGSKDLKMGTVKAAVKQLGIDWDDFSEA
jgi:predicted RNA binding protein YcfA (HicA-like mRNA interferase family)